MERALDELTWTTGVCAFVVAAVLGVEHCVVRVVQVVWNVWIVCGVRRLKIRRGIEGGGATIHRVWVVDRRGRRGCVFNAHQILADAVGWGWDGPGYVS